MKQFHELSYKLHEKSFYETDTESKRIQQSWFEETTVDHWRHFRMIEPLKGFLQQYKNAECVTIGDGRFGLDSFKLKKLEPTLRILPTDISPNLLQQAKEQRIIDDYRVENAEKLSFQDGQFDFAFCIESYHHFPRPFVALYEMLRISKKAVVLVEPNDYIPGRLPQQLFHYVKGSVRRFLKKNGHPEYQHFEEAGNYVFTVSKREIEKVAIGLQLPTVAFYYFNDWYEKGAEFEKVGPRSGIYKRLKRKIKFNDLKCSLRLSSYGHIIAIIFKEKPADGTIELMRRRGFTVIDLPENPYLKNLNLNGI